MFLLANQEQRRVLRNQHPIISRNPHFKQVYKDIRVFLNAYTIHLSKIYKNTSDAGDCHEKMLQITNNNRFTVGYCVLFTK